MQFLEQHQVRQVHSSLQAYDVINRTYTVISFISLKSPSHKMLNNGYGPLGHPRRTAGRGHGSF